MRNDCLDGVHDSGDLLYCQRYLEDLVRGYRSSWPEKNTVEKEWV